MTYEIIAKIAWKKIRGVIFDVDGTLYDQRRLRMMMLPELGRYIFQNKHAIRNIKIISHFRRTREELASNEADNVFQRQLIIPANYLSVPPQLIEELVDEWIYRRPLKYMLACRFPLVDTFFEALRVRGTKIGIFSDYPVEKKLAALGLRADATCYSLEPGLDRLKPQTLGLETIVNRLSLDKSDCVFIGDRDSHDGKCARLFGMPFLLCRGRDFYKQVMLESVPP